MDGKHREASSPQRQIPKLQTAVLIRVRENDVSLPRCFAVSIMSDVKLRDIPLPNLDSYLDECFPYLLTPREQCFERLLDWNLTFYELGIRSGSTLLVHPKSMTITHQEQWEPNRSDVETTSPPSRMAPGSLGESNAEAHSQFASSNISPVATPISHLEERKGVMSNRIGTLRLGGSSTIDLLKKHEDVENSHGHPSRPGSRSSTRQPLTSITSCASEHEENQLNASTRFGKYILGTINKSLSNIHFLGDGGALENAIEKKEVKIVESVQLKCSNIDFCTQENMRPLQKQQPQSQQNNPNGSESKANTLPSPKPMTTKPTPNTNTNTTTPQITSQKETELQTKATTNNLPNQMKQNVSPNTLPLLRFSVIKDFVGSFCLLISKDRTNDGKAESIVVAAYPLLYKANLDEVVIRGKTSTALRVDDLRFIVQSDPDTLGELSDALTYAYTSMYSTSNALSSHSSLVWLRNLRMRFATVDLAKSLSNFNQSFASTSRSFETTEDTYNIINRHLVAKLYKQEPPYSLPDLTSLIDMIKATPSSTRLATTLSLVFRYGYLIDKDKRGEAIDCLCTELGRLNSWEETPVIDKEDVDKMLMLLDAFISCPGPTAPEDQIPMLCEAFMDLQRRLIDEERYFSGTDKEEEINGLLMRSEATRKELKLFLRELPAWNNTVNGLGLSGRRNMEVVPLDNNVVICSSSASGNNKANTFVSNIYCSLVVLPSSVTSSSAASATSLNLLLDSNTGFFPSISTGCTKAEQTILASPAMGHWVQTGLQLELELLETKGEHVSTVERVVYNEQRVRRRILEAMMLVQGLVKKERRKEISVYPEIVRLVSGVDGGPCCFICAVLRVKDIGDIDNIINANAQHSMALAPTPFSTYLEHSRDVFSTPNVPLFSLKPNILSVTFPLTINAFYTSPCSKIVISDSYDSDVNEKGSTRVIMMDVDGDNVLVYDGHIPSIELFDHRVTVWEWEELLEGFGRDRTEKSEPENKGGIVSVVLEKLRELISSLPIDLPSPDLALYRLSPIVLDESGSVFGIVFLLLNSVSQKNIVTERFRLRFTSCGRYMAYLAAINFQTRYSQFILSRGADKSVGAGEYSVDAISNVLLWGNDVLGYEVSDTLNSLQLLIAPGIKEAEFVRTYVMRRLTKVLVTRTMCVLGKFLSPSAAAVLHEYISVCNGETGGDSGSTDNLLNMDKGEKFDGTMWEKVIDHCHKCKSQDPLSGSNSMAMCDSHCVPSAGSCLSLSEANVIREGFDVNFADFPKETVNINERCFNYLDYKVDLTNAYIGMKGTEGKAGAQAGSADSTRHINSGSCSLVINDINDSHNKSSSAKGFYRSHSRFASSVGVIDAQGRGAPGSPSISVAAALNAVTTAFGQSSPARRVRSSFEPFQEVHGGIPEEVFMENIKDDTSALRPYTWDIGVLRHREEEIEEARDHCREMLEDMCFVEQKEKNVVAEATMIGTQLRFDNEYGTKQMTPITRSRIGGATERSGMGMVDSADGRKAMTQSVPLQTKTRGNLTSTQTLYHSVMSKKTPSGEDLFRKGKPILRLVGDSVDKSSMIAEGATGGTTGGSGAFKRRTQTSGAFGMITKSSNSPISRTLFVPDRRQPPSSLSSSTLMSSTDSDVVRFLEICSEFQVVRIPFGLICPHVRKFDQINDNINFEEEGIDMAFEENILTLKLKVEVSMELLYAVTHGTEFCDVETLKNRNVLYNTFILMVLFEFSTFKNLFTILANAYHSRMISIGDIDVVLECVLNSVEDTDGRFLNMIRPMMVSPPEDSTVRNIIFYVILRYATIKPNTDTLYTLCDFSDIVPMFQHFRTDMNISRIYCERLTRTYFCKIAESEEENRDIDCDILVNLTTVGLYVRNLDLSSFDFSVTKPESIVRFFPLIEKVDVTNTHLSLQQILRVFRPCVNLTEIRLNELSVSACRHIMAELKVKVVNV